jgi:hypothetical protein
MSANSIPPALRPLLRSLVLFSGACFGVTLILNLAPLLNGRNAPVYLWAVLVPAGWIVNIAALWIIGARLHSSKSLAYWKAFWPGTPRWMTYALLLILALSVYVWHVSVFRASLAPREGFDFSGTAPMLWVDTLLFGAAFRVFYSASKESDPDESSKNSG